MLILTEHADVLFATEDMPCAVILDIVSQNKHLLSRGSMTMMHFFEAMKAKREPPCSEKKRKFNSSYHNTTTLLTHMYFSTVRCCPHTSSKKSLEVYPAQTTN